MGYRIRPFTADEARAVSAWTYDEPFDIYNGEGDDGALLVTHDDEGLGYYAIVDVDTDEVVGFCCFGPEGRVVGQAEEPRTLDVGGGVRPDLVSRGIATEVFPLILDFASRFSPERFRTAVASFNERSTRLCVSAGFRVEREFEGPAGRPFRELVRPAQPSTGSDVGHREHEPG